MDISKLLPLLQEKARKYVKPMATDSLTGFLFDERSPAAAQFYLSPAGITFCYNPYDIASYAAGPIQLLVPYCELSHWLTPRFRQRIRLQE